MQWENVTIILHSDDKEHVVLWSFALFVNFCFCMQCMYFALTSFGVLAFALG